MHPLQSYGITSAPTVTVYYYPPSPPPPPGTYSNYFANYQPADNSSSGGWARGGMNKDYLLGEQLGLLHL
jgi:hypothetical protein